MSKTPKSLLPEALQKEASDLMKGESPMPPGVRLVSEAKQLVMSNTRDLEGSLKAVLCEIIDGSKSKIDAHRDTPSDIVLKTLEIIMQNDHNLGDFGRRVDAKWGAMNQQRPYFNAPGETPHPDDPYTFEGVRATLEKLQQSLKA